MNVKKGGKITIDKLAIMVAEGFERTATKDDIERLEIKIESVENKLEGTNKRIDDFVVTRVKYEDHNKLKARMDVIEGKFK